MHEKQNYILNNTRFPPNIGSRFMKIKLRHEEHYKRCSVRIETYVASRRYCRGICHQRNTLIINGVLERISILCNKC